ETDAQAATRRRPGRHEACEESRECGGDRLMSHPGAQKTDRVVATLMAYLNSHPLPTTGPEYITRDPQRQMVLVRWPNGTLRWQTIVSMEALGFTVPSKMQLEHV